MAQRNEFVVVRDNDDQILAYARSERLAREGADEMNDDEAAYQGCKVSELEFPAYVKQVKWDDEG